MGIKKLGWVNLLTDGRYDIIETEKDLIEEILERFSKSEPSIAPLFPELHEMWKTEKWFPKLEAIAQSNSETILAIAVKSTKH